MGSLNRFNKKLLSLLDFSKKCKSTSLVASRVTTPLWAKCEDETHTPKSGNLESSGTPANSELDCSSQNTLHWGVLYTIGNVLKCRCLKWPCMSHLDICSPSYAQKKLPIWLSTTKSRESTRIWRQQVKCNTSLESSQRELQDCFKLDPSRRSEQEVMDAQSLGSPNRDSFGTPLWESREKVTFGCKSCRGTQRILYGGRRCLPPSSNRGESSESVLLVACPNTKGDPECELTNLWLVCDAGPCN
jgi:hypothetical protein